MCYFDGKSKLCTSLMKQKWEIKLLFKLKNCKEVYGWVNLAHMACGGCCKYNNEHVSHINCCDV
jgi:hypothetical protein